MNKVLLYVLLTIRMPVVFCGLTECRNEAVFRGLINVLDRKQIFVFLVLIIYITKLNEKK